MKFFRLLSSFIQRHSWGMVVCGILFIIAGLRFAITDRNTTALPISDDWYHLEWLRTFSTDEPDYGYPFRYHNEHYYAAAPVFTLLAFKLNGLWDIRLETLIYSLVYVLYAGTLMWFFLRTTGGRGRLALSLLALVFLALPVSGFRAAWGYLSGFPVAMTTGLAAVHLAVHAGGRWSRVVASLVCAGVSTAALAGCGSLMALAVAGILGVRALRQRRCTAADLVLIGGMLMFTALAVLTKPPIAGDPPAITPAILLSAVTRSLAWPSVFAPPAAVLNMLPGVLLAIAWWRKPEMRTPAVEAILAVHAFLLLQAVGVAVFRGENSNMAMPSNRYYDILLVTPFVAVAACVVLLRAFPNRPAPHVAAWLLMFGLAGGAGIHFFYRMWPYVARENGEWVEAEKVNWVRGVLADGWQAPAYAADGADTNETEVSMQAQVDLLKSWVEKKGDDPLLPGTMITGHPLQPASSGPFVLGGLHRAYAGRPGMRYWGSYNTGRSRDTGTFVSDPFTARGSYLVFDLVLQKKSRFSFYRLPDCELNVVDVASGEKIPVLPRLLRSWPSLLRDREAATVPVIAGRSYRVEASDSTADNWFAFSEPADSGRLAPLLMGLTASGKLLALLGVMLAATGLLGLRLNPAASSPNPPANK
jgi:hypothetical protein